MDNFTKITTGWVKQYFESREDGTFVCTSQEFIAGDEVEFEDVYQDHIEPPKRKVYQYQPFNMVQPGNEQRQEDLLDACKIARKAVYETINGRPAPLSIVHHDLEQAIAKAEQV